MRNRLLILLPATVALAVAVGGCDRSAAPASNAVPAPAPAASPVARVDRQAVAQPERENVAKLLAHANQRFGASQFAAPAGDNALEGFLAVLALDADNASAREGLVEIYPFAVLAVQRALDAGELDEATRVLDLLRRAAPDALDVAELSERLERAREPRAGADTAPPPPSSDDRPAPAIDAPAVTTVATRTAAAGQTTAATLTENRAAARIAPPPARPAAQAAAGEDRDSAAAAPVGPTLAAESPAMQASATSTVDASVVPPAIEDRVDPAYPDFARTRRIEGWVELEFLVDVLGRAQDIRVVDASAGAVFNVAATRALQRWRFQPGTRDGRPEETRMRTRITFNLG